MSAEFVVQVFICILLVVFTVLFAIVACKWQDEVHLNYELQDENSDMIERNEKLDTYLDETRAVVITQNETIRDLHDSKYLPSKIYLIVDLRTGIFYGCFYSKKKADKYTSTSVDYVVRDIEIHN